MNTEMRKQLGLEKSNAIGIQLESLLTVGSKIFYQTHFYPLIKMQKSVREIFLQFKGQDRIIPVLLNVEVAPTPSGNMINCGGMEISNRNRYEKELIEAKKIAENALTENVSLNKIKNELLEQQKILELQYRTLQSLKEEQQEVYKLISHDLQEPLRKSIFFSNYLLADKKNLSDNTVERLQKIIHFNSEMREMLLILMQYRELEGRHLHYEKLQLHHIIEKVLKKSKKYSSKYLQLDYPTKSPEFYGDEQLMMRFMEELLRNSQKNKDPNTEKLIIKVDSIETTANSFFVSSENYQYSKYLKITYEDNSLATSTKLFKIIQKTPELDRINIGLAYCKQIVEKHEGTITAKLMEPKGIRYTILLPLKNPY